MLNLKRTAALLASCALAFAAADVARAQSGSRSVQTDARWYPWMGCWQSDSSGGTHGGASTRTTCVVPVAGSSAVDALTLVRGKVVARDRLDATGKAHSVSVEGCDGFESVHWSSTGHRVFLRSEFTCVGGTKGTSTTLFAFSPAGEWLHVAEVRSGGGAILSVDRRRDVGTSAELPQDAARAIERYQLAVTTGRAAATVSITADEIIDALRNVDASVVRSWLVASGERFDLDQHQLVSLARAGAPPAVMQAVMGSAARDQDSLSTSSNRSADAYLNTPVYSPSITAQGAAATYQRMNTMYVCPPNGCYPPNPYSPRIGYSSYQYSPYPSFEYSPYPYGYAVPFMDRRREMREPFRQPERPHQPVPRGPVGRWP